MTETTNGLPVQTTFHGLGTEIGLALWPAAGQEPAARAALQRARAFIERAERRLSRFQPDSELSRVNRGGGRPVAVSPFTLGAIAVAIEAAAATGGLFDPTVYHALRAAGYDRSFPLLSAGVQTGAWQITDDRQRPGRWAEVRLDHRQRTVQLPIGVGLDLGGIAKGWLADIVARRLGRHGAALVDLGGDIDVHGLPPGEAAWRIDVAAPEPALPPLGRLVVGREAGIATSGTTRRRWQTPVGGQHHLIDPRTGQPAVTDLASVTVIASTAAAAEVAAKGLLLLGCAAARQALVETPGVGGVLVRGDGAIFTGGAIVWQPAADAQERMAS